MRTDEAVFVLVSDFGRKEATAGLSPPELAARVTEISRSVWKSQKQADVIDVVVPYRPLGRDALRAMFQQQFERLETLNSLRRLNVRQVLRDETLLE